MNKKFITSEDKFKLFQLKFYNSSILGIISLLPYKLSNKTITFRENIHLTASFL
jgi:hypothetical protein